MKFDKSVLSDFDASLALEWIETNGLGGYASGTVAGAHSRRYHGLLVAAIQPPVGRANVLSKLEETIILENEKYALSSNQFPGVVHPNGFMFLERFERDLFPEFYYKVQEIELKKTIVALHGENTTLILYEVIQAPGSFEMELLPLYASRDFHGLSKANDYIGRHYIFEEGVFRTFNYHCCPELFIAVPRSQFTEAKGWYYNFEYHVDQQRGMDYREDLYTHGKFSVAMKAGDKLGIIISTEDPTGRDPFQLFEAEVERRQEITKNFSGNEPLRRLALAADQFIVKRGRYSTIVAGYHWFADWGRDTMISLPGLCLVTGRYGEAKQILLQFSEKVSEGMLPNRFPDHGDIPEYNTIDATLWFFYAVYQYYKYTKDKDLVKKMMPVLLDIVDWHYKGTRYNIKVDPADELLGGGQEGVQLTWMDAKVGDWVVTPRRGKPVEINALWHNALCTLEFLFVELNNPDAAKEYKAKAKKVSRNFNALFWNEGQNYLFDYVDGNHKNNDLRPNQLYAICLPFPLLKKDRAKKVLETVTNDLLTSRGLRSLSPFHKDYSALYQGNVWSRDGAYHQGTVWSFLIGPYIDALVVVNGKNGKKEAALFLIRFLEHLNEAGVGTISEIFDGALPHSPRGCIAQAWGVAETFRVAVEYKLLDPVNKLPSH